jgi:adenine phosphoribosyltransferase
VYLDHLRAAVRSVDDFPKPGIVFRDLTPILLDPVLYSEMLLEHIDAAAALNPTKEGDLNPTKIVGMESRGFWFGPQLAFNVGAGFVPARKPGKLPCPTVSQQYGLEYGRDEIHIHTDAIKSGDKVLIVDDLLATGGTAEAVGKIVRSMGGEIVGFLFAIELDDLKGRARLDAPVSSLLHF